MKHKKATWLYSARKTFSSFFNPKTQWQKGTSENTLNIHVPELNHARRVLFILTLASCGAPRMVLGWSLHGSLSFGGVQQVPWHGSVLLLGWMYPPAAHGAGRRVGAASTALPLPHRPGARAGWAVADLPAAYQGCLLTIHCLGWQYSAYGFVTTSLWVLSTSLALA